MESKTIKFTINGQAHEICVKPWRTLLEVIREDLNLTGTKEGCGEGECGSCTVIMGGKTVNSCLVPAMEANNQEIITGKPCIRSRRPLSIIRECSADSAHRA
jgi:carbon-monoxide dehydrogenase small subunit